MLDFHAGRALGRYAHEALAIDPDTGTIYLTESGEPFFFARNEVPEDSGSHLQHRHATEAILDHAAPPSASRSSSRGGELRCQAAVDPHSHLRAPQPRVRFSVTPSSTFATVSHASTADSRLS
jgi:hypothetical protein